MFKKSSLILVFLLVISISFVNASNIIWTESKICNHVKGCWDGVQCYPFGYIKEGYVCANKYNNLTKHNLRGFYPQLNSGEFCEYDFECKSNFCFNNQCVSELNTLIIDIASKIINPPEIVSNLKVENLSTNNSFKQIIENKSQKGITGFFTKLFSFRK